jgi:two-component system, OmpR family, response regulator CpxR
MPVMDGLAFRQAQRQAPHLTSIPVVVMSAVEELLAPQVTAEAYLPKPIDFDALLPFVQQYCSQSQQSRL